MRTNSLKQKTAFALILFIVSLLYTLPVNAQITNGLANIDDFFRAQITNELASIDVFFRAIADGQDILKMSKENGHYILFYRQGADIMFANNQRNSNTRSYGRISNVSYKKNIEKDGSNSDVFHFKWYWQNSYDSETGIADVFVKVVTSEDAVVARIIIVSGDLEHVLDYGGIFLGSLSSLK